MTTLLKILFFIAVWIAVTALFMGPMNSDASLLFDVLCAAGWALLTQIFEKTRFVSV